MRVKIYKKDNTVIERNDIQDIEQLYDRIRRKDFLFIRCFYAGNLTPIVIEDIEEIKIRMKEGE